MNPVRVLVTGGCGYIGSHTCVALLEAGYQVTIIDNLSNSRRDVVSRVERITGKSLEFVEGDVRDQALVLKVLQGRGIEVVLHFAGLKAVGESVASPGKYYACNVGGTIQLLEAMDASSVKRLVFSSSATVYGEPLSVPICEDFPLAPTNPYGRSKLMVEEMLRDMAIADSSWRVAILRYFNPTGAHESGLIGEDPNGVPSNLMPYITQVAAGRLSELSVFGSDYPTPDGTCIRDYIHVVDLADGHVKALEALDQRQVTTVNLGTGRGYSVLDIVAAFEQASNQKIKYRIADRRSGDAAQCFADPALAHTLLGWEAHRDLGAMCRDAWRWQVNQLTCDSISNKDLAT